MGANGTSKAWWGLTGPDGGNGGWWGPGGLTELMGLGLLEGADGAGGTAPSGAGAWWLHPLDLCPHVQPHLCSDPLLAPLFPSLVNPGTRLYPVPLCPPASWSGTGQFCRDSMGGCPYRDQEMGGSRDPTPSVQGCDLGEPSPWGADGDTAKRWGWHRRVSPHPRVQWVPAPPPASAKPCGRTRGLAQAAGGAWNTEETVGAAKELQGLRR